MHKVFVYGTLKRGGTFNNSIMSSGAKFVKEATTRNLKLFIGKGLYPHVFEGDSDIDRDWETIIKSTTTL